MKKQFIAKLVVLAMVLAMVPVTVLAASAAGSNYGYSPDYGYYSVGDDTIVVIAPGGAADGSFKLTVDKDKGVANAIVNDSVISSLADLAKDGKVVLKLEADGASTVNFTCSAKALAKLAADSGADLVMEFGSFTITIPNDVLAEIGSAGTARITIETVDDGVTVTLEVAGEVVYTETFKAGAAE